MGNDFSNIIFVLVIHRNECSVSAKEENRSARLHFVVMYMVSGPIHPPTPSPPSPPPRKKKKVLCTAQHYNIIIRSTKLSNITLSAASLFAPADRSSWTTFARPFSAAFIRGVFPSYKMKKVSYYSDRSTNETNICHGDTVRVRTTYRR